MSTDMNICDKNPKYSIDSKYIFVKATYEIHFLFF